MSAPVAISEPLVVGGVRVSGDHWIGGSRVGSGATIEVDSPIDGRVLGAIAAGGPDEVDLAVSAARAAFPAWAALGPGGRAPILGRFAELIREHAGPLSILETTDNGSLLIGNEKRIVERSAHNVDFFAELALQMPGEVIAGAVCDNEVHYDPAGVAALIVPWNAPLMLGTWKIGPALAAGNTVVVKPAEWAPLSLSMLADLAAQAGIPDGVYNVVQGTGERAGAALVAHPDIDRISFTGSPETGRLIGASAAAGLVPASFELGGKSPFIVFADADLDVVAKELAGQYVNAGQVCLAGTRVLVERSVEAELLERARVATGRLPVGDPRDRATRVGPLITDAHFDRVKGYVDRAVADGATVLWGGGPHERGGRFFAPTLLAGVAQTDEIVQHEVFGPVLTWQTFEDERELIALANGTEYGLAASVFTADERRARRVADALVAGTVWVNCFFVRDLAAPFGGSRISGTGREGGRWSFDFYCDVKNVAIRRDSFGTVVDGRADG